MIYNEMMCVNGICDCIESDGLQKCADAILVRVEWKGAEGSELCCEAMTRNE